MLFNIKVIPNASKSRVCFESKPSSPRVRWTPKSHTDSFGAGEEKGEGILKVYVKSPPVDSRANKELIEVLAEHFNVKRNQIEIIRGVKSRMKVVKIL